MELSKTNNKDHYIKAHVLEGKTWYKDYLLVIVIAVLLIVFTVLNPQFIGIDNIFSILNFASLTGIIALGMTIIMIISGIDLSGAVIANLSAIISVYLVTKGINNLLIIFTISILAAIVASLINSILVVYIKIPSFIVTIATSVLIQGFCRSIAFGGAGVIYPKKLPHGFAFLGTHDLGKLIPMPVIIFIVTVFIMIIIIEHSPLGRKMYAVGSNPEVSRHVGIEVNKVQIYGFLLAGLLYGIAGIIMSSQYAAAMVGMSDGYLFPAVISILLGMIFLSLKFANIKGTFISAILLSILVNGFTMINLPFYWKNVVQGLLLISVVVVLSSVKRESV